MPARQVLALAAGQAGATRRLPGRSGWVAAVQRLRQRSVGQGMAAALGTCRSGRRVCGRKLDGAQEAHLAALACGTPPHGRARWTLRLLASRVEPSGPPDMGGTFEQLAGETRGPLPPRPGSNPGGGRVGRHGHVYVRSGVASPFLRNRNGLRRACEPLAGEPLAGWRHGAATPPEREASAAVAALPGRPGPVQLGPVRP